MTVRWRAGAPRCWLGTSTRRTAHKTSVSAFGRQTKLYFQTSSSWWNLETPLSFNLSSEILLLLVLAWVHRQP